MIDNQQLSTNNYRLTDKNKDLLRFLTCGSVDDGKSTLIGRLLFDTKKIFDDQLKEVENESKKYGTHGDELDLALLVDGLQSEREQGITIDVAYRFFSTKKRKFIIIDTPGHEQYTRNMVTGASLADCAVVLLDATKGILTQTKRHSFLVSLMGIKSIIVVINKMDLVNFSKDRFEEIKQDYITNILDKLPHNDKKSLHVEFVPISALLGDNIVSKSKNTPWYDGVTFLDMLESVSYLSDNDSLDFRLPIQYVNRLNSDFRGYCGTVASGKLRVEDEVTILPSGVSTKIKEILYGKKSIEEAASKMSITITTKDEVDIGRGDVVVLSDKLPRLSNNLKVKLVWLDEEPMICTKAYDIKSTTNEVSGKFEYINYKIDVDTFKRKCSGTLELNDIASCKMVLNRPIVVDAYKKNRQMGSFIVIDRITNKTVGAGMVENVSRREEDVEKLKKKPYTPAEIALNKYIRDNFPEWECKKI